jgi:hypothetical protein
MRIKGVVVKVRRGVMREMGARNVVRRRVRDAMLVVDEGLVVWFRLGWNESGFEVWMGCGVVCWSYRALLNIVIGDDVT